MADQYINELRPAVTTIPMDLSGDGCLPRCTAPAVENRIWDALAAGCVCQGTTATVKRRLKAHGGVVITLQCDRCGKSLTGDLSKQHFPFYLDLPEWDQQHRDSWWDSAERNEAQRQRLAAFEAALEKRRQNYSAFRQTPEWQSMRQRVMARARFVCEGCGDGPAEVVHHLTYEHGVAPPLWHLRAVCRPCHGRLHRAGDPWHDQRLPVAG